MVKMIRRAAIYARVSTEKQSTTQQLAELRAAAERHGWQVVEEFVETVSGAKGRDQRPKLDAMMKAATRQEFDVIMAWSLDRLGRSLQHLVALLGDLRALKVDLYLHETGIDTSTPSGELFFHVAGAFAQFERSLIRERVIAGLKRAKSQGKQLGRPPVPQALRDKVLALRKEGLGMIRIAKRVRCGVGTVQKIVA